VWRREFFWNFAFAGKFMWLLMIKKFDAIAGHVFGFTGVQ